MAKKRKNRKSRQQPLQEIPAIEKRLLPQTGQAVQSASVAPIMEKEDSAKKKSGKSGISAPGFIAGLFLAFILGIYVGTLLPEMKTSQQAAKVREPAPTPPMEQQQNGVSSAPSSQFMPASLSKREKEILQSLSGNPSQENLWIELGDLYFDAKMPSQSINAYSHALAINPANPDVLTDMGVMYRDMGDFQKALECFRNAYAINPAHSQSRYNEGIVLANDLHQHEEAKKAWQELLRYKPNAISPNGTPLRQLIEEQNP